MLHATPKSDLMSIREGLSREILIMILELTLAHIKKKDETTAYLAHIVLTHVLIHGKNIVVAFDDHAEATHRKVNLSSIQEEAGRTFFF